MELHDVSNIRGCAPKAKDDSYLEETTRNQILLAKDFGFPGTWLMQHDALPIYQYASEVKPEKFYEGPGVSYRHAGFAYELKARSGYVDAVNKLFHPEGRLLELAAMTS